MQVANELERIRLDTADTARPAGWDWNSFASTLIATLVGAAAAGIVTLWVLRRQRRDQYEQVIQGAAQRGLSALLTYARSVTKMGPDGDVPFEQIELQAELLMLQALCDDDDRRVAAAIRQLGAVVFKSSNAESVAVAIAALSGSLARLVARRHSVDEQIAEIHEARDRLLAEGGSDGVEDAL